LIGKLLLGYVDTSSSTSTPPIQTDNDGFDLPAPRLPKSVDIRMLESKNSEEEEEDIVAGTWEVSKSTAEKDGNI
jgi:hypothetical protein